MVECASVPDQALAVAVEPASGLAPSGFDPSRVRRWLHEMAKQGEDRVWRGAKLALEYLDGTATEVERLYRIAKANNQLASINAQHRDEWRARATRYAEAIDLALHCTPANTNFYDCGDPFAILREAIRDSDEHPKGEDPQGLSGEVMPARAEGIAQTSENEDFSA